MVITLIKRWAIFIFPCISLTVFSCSKKTKKAFNCIYSIDSLVRDYDTSKFFVQHFKDKRVVDFIEPRSKYGEAGIYTFDESDNLRFYGFLRNDSNMIDFSIQYDSLGNEVARTGGEVVNGYFRKIGSDSLKFTFFLLALNYSYSDIVVKNGIIKIEPGQLYKSDIFSNLIGKTITISFDSKHNNKMVYIEGIRENTCTKKMKHFIDSTIIPSEVY